MTEGNQAPVQQSAQTANPSPPAEAGSGQALSPETIKAVVAETVQEALRSYERQQQSQRDKMEARIKNRLQAYEQTFKGINPDADLTPTQREQLRAAARREVEAEGEEQPTRDVSTQPPAQVAQKEQPNPVEQFALSIMQRAGTMIEDSDPEAAIIADATIDTLFDKVNQAIETKKARLQASGVQAANRVSAAVTGGTPGNPISHITDPSELLRMGLNRGKGR